MNRKFLKEIREIPAEKWHYECRERHEKGEDGLSSRNSHVTYFEDEYMSKIRGMKISLIHESSISEREVPYGDYGWKTESDYVDCGYSMNVSQNGVKEFYDNESEAERLFGYVEKLCESNLHKKVCD